MTFLKLALALAALGAAGAGAIAALTPAHGRRGVLPFLGTSFIVGWGLVGLASVAVMLLGGRAGPWVPAVCAVAGLLLLAWKRPRFEARPEDGKGAWGRAAVALGVVVSLVLAALSDDAGWDFTAFWSIKARSLEHYGTFRNPDFTSDVRPHYHPRYPLLVPAVQSWVYAATGSTSATVIRLAMAVFFVSSLGVLYGALRDRLPASAARWATSVYAFTPAVMTGEGGGAVSGYADYPLAVFALLGAVEGARWLETQDRRSAILAALAFACAAQTKDEGGAVVACAAIVIAVLAMRARGWAGAVRSFAISAPAAVVFALWIWARSGLLPDPENVAGSAGVQWAWMPKVFRLLLSQFVRFKEWSVHWVLIGLTLAWRFPKPRDPRSLLPWMGLALLAAYTIAWMTFPTTDAKKIMQHSVNRLVLHVLPVFFVWSAYRLYEWAGEGGASAGDHGEAAPGESPLRPSRPPG